MVLNEELVMNEAWAEFDDFELACLCADYGFEDELEIASILPLRLSNRSRIEELLIAVELDMAFGE